MAGFEHISPGSKWKPSSIEINAMKDAARAYQGGSGVTPPRLTQGGLALNPICVRVKNATAGDRDRYTVFSLGEPTWEMEDSQYSLPTCIFELVAYDSSKPAAVLIQPLEEDQFGYACVSGPVLAKVTNGGSSSDRVGNPNASGVLVPGSGSIVLAHSRPSAGGYVLALLGAGGGSSMRMFKTPSGGIPAAVLLLPGSATCTEYPGGMGAPAGSTATVKNHRTSIIPGNVFILAQAFGADLFCIEGNCPTTLIEPDPEP
jgi:hypothetical protein